MLKTDLWGLGQRLTRKKREGTFCSKGHVLYFDRGLCYTGVCICQNSVHVHLRFVHFVMYKFYFKVKHCKSRTPVNDMHAEVFRRVLQFTLKSFKKMY